MTRKLEDRFFNSLMRAWFSIKDGLGVMSPMADEERNRQPIVWNPLFSVGTHGMLGKRPYLDWGPLDSGPAQTFKDWKDFRALPESEKEATLSKFKGGHIMFNEVENVLSVVEIHQQEGYVRRWWGIFSQSDVMLGARAVGSSGQTSFFFASSSWTIAIKSTRGMFATLDILPSN